MRLFNTLSRKVEEIIPLHPDQVSLYTCGPTVYDFQHIGNFRTFLLDDTLRRVLGSHGWQVKHVMNITDVGHLVSDADEGEDKLEKGASREGKTVWQIAEQYTDIFKEDVCKLNILAPSVPAGQKDNYARATDFIDQQIGIAQALLDRGFAYISEKAIYFDTSKLPSYGELTGQLLASKEVGVRSDVVTDSAKRHPQDFAVWFFTIGRFAGHSMHWPSPWGEGFPGWHLECSAIIHTLLGDPIDIHTGGVDNIGTHHVNEMAQTEAAFAHKLANYWVHGEHLLVDNQKMSKSKNNFYTLKDIEARNIDPIAFRLLVLQAHYRSRLNFTWDNLAAAQNRLNRWQAIADLRWQAYDTADDGDEDNTALLTALQAMELSLKNDLDTPGALAAIEEAFTVIENGLAEALKSALIKLLEQIRELLGIDLLASADITAAQKDLIQAREEARASQDWQSADKLRDSLLEQGIEVRDTAQGTIWHRS